MELDPIELSDEDIEVIRATQGADGGALRRLRAGRREKLGVPVERGAARGWLRCSERGGLRRVAAILYHRRAGFSRQRHGRVGGARTARSWTPAAGWPPSAASATATSARRTPTGRTRSSRWPTAARRRSATRCWTRSPSDTGIERARDAVLEHRVQEGPDALLHRRLQALGRGARALSTSSLSDTRSAELYRRALHVLPGGVNSPVRAMRAIGRDPIFVERGAARELTDVDGNVYVDYVCSWGPLIHGHAHRRSEVVRARRGPAPSIRQLPTLKLFKIRMDLEMEGGTDALKTAGEAVEPMELDPIELSDEDIDGHQGHAGPDGGALRRLRAGGGEARRAGRATCCAAGVAAGARRAAPRGRDPLPPPRGLLGQRHGRVGRAGRRDPRHRPPDGRVPRHQPLLPAPDVRRLAVLRLHDGPRPLEGGVRRGAGRDRRATRGIEQRATLYSSTEFKKVRMLYFTDDFKRWEEEHAS